MKIAATVILYHPSEETFTNIQSYYNFVDKIYVFDNSEKDSVIKSQLLQLPKVEFYQNYKNEGIAKRLNEACNKALDEKFDWIITMDQDTSFQPEAIQNYIDCFRKFQNKEKVAGFGPEHDRELKQSTRNCTAVEMQKLITSGMLLNLSLFKEIGGFDEALFIDSVDSDYCIRAKIAGYSIIQFLNIYIQHELGKEVYASSIKSLFIIKKRKEIHSPLRCYYMYRNLLYIEDKFKNHDKSMLTPIRGYVIGQLKACIFYGRNAKEIILYLRQAKSDFKNKRMGKIGENKS